MPILLFAVHEKMSKNPSEIIGISRNIAVNEPANLTIIDPERSFTYDVEKGFSKKKKTWHFQAENVRDFAFASSRKYIWDAMAVNINGKTVMAISLYPKEGNPLWEEHSTRVVANTLEEYSKMTQKLLYLDYNSHYTP